MELHRNAAPTAPAHPLRMHLQQLDQLVAVVDLPHVRAQHPVQRQRDGLCDGVQQHDEDLAQGEHGREGWDVFDGQ